MGYVSLESVLRLPSSSESYIPRRYCDSLRLAVETNNAGAWDCVPRRCMGFMERYIRGVRYLRDSEVIAKFSSDFTKTVLPLVGDGKDALVFDVDETLLSNADLFFNMTNRGPSDKDKVAIVYKSEQREKLLKEGYRIHGNSGDQWSDLWGYAVATRSFKLPNLMYYVA